ncbi:MAG: hypothetical protein KAU20_05140 [Nanoarchaeota archaeon]|nr:hypothetical protein [Nanoarchaeota archaeon]
MVFSFSGGVFLFCQKLKVFEHAQKSLISDMSKKKKSHWKESKAKEKFDKME